MRNIFILLVNIWRARCKNSLSDYFRIKITVKTAQAFLPRLNEWVHYRKFDFITRFNRPFFKWRVENSKQDSIQYSNFDRINEQYGNFNVFWPNPHYGLLNNWKKTQQNLSTSKNLFTVIQNQDEIASRPAVYGMDNVRLPLFHWMG